MEINFSDLTKRAQARLLREAGVNGPKEMNWDVLPVTEIIFDFEGSDPEQERTDESEDEEFCVSMKVDGRYYAYVRATSLEAAAEKASACFTEADFGELECIASEFVNITDKNDDIHDYMGGGKWS